MYYANETIKYCRTILRLPDAQKWNPEALQNITATPWEIHAQDAVAPEVVFKEPEPPAEVATRAEEPLQRRRLYF